AVEAHACARLRVLERHEAGGDVGRMRADRGVMRRDPASGRAVAGFAAYPFGELETGAPLCRRSISCMAAEAGRLAGGIAHAERSGDLPSAHPGQNRESAAVRARGRTRLLPGCDLILPHDGPV